MFELHHMHISKKNVSLGKSKRKSTRGRQRFIIWRDANLHNLVLTWLNPFGFAICSEWLSHTSVDTPTWLTSSLWKDCFDRTSEICQVGTNTFDVNCRSLLCVNHWLNCKLWYPWELNTARLLTVTDEHKQCLLIIHTSNSLYSSINLLIMVLQPWFWAVL